MRRFQTLAVCAALLLLQGCVSSNVQQGAAYGAVAGMTAGGVIGYAISDDSLLGSDETPGTYEGDMALGGTAIVSGLAIGAVFGGIVGAMVGHQRERPNDVYLQTQAQAEADANSDDQQQLGLSDDELGASDTLGPRAY